MDPDFIQVKDLHGELKFTHKFNRMGITVSTEEMVVQRPHLNMRIQLEHVTSIKPEKQMKHTSLPLNAQHQNGVEWVRPQASTPPYRIYVQQMMLHHRSGKSTLGPTDLVLPLHQDVMEAIAEHSGLVSLPEVNG
ncbi:hypothetical protein [Marinicrinis sediminis]|uniref:Uncharacterized protein n=1 Tax=Marinicrinis sediminis TaxID=1652465 RepID=A0ABW5RDV0_9BACL